MKHTLLLLLLVSLSACASVAGYPDQPDSVPSTVASLDKSTMDSLIIEYNKVDTSADRKKTIRNQIIYSDISQIDEGFNNFKRDLNSQENSLSLGADFTSLALAGLGATVGAAETKAALAAASAGIIGAKASIDKDILYQKTITALVTEMDAQRSEVFARIIANTNLDVTKYPLEFSSKDIQDYYEAGTLVNALEGVNQSASTKAQAATVQVNTALSANYSYDSVSKKIETFWRPDGKTIDPNAAVKISKCMMQDKISGSVTFLINAGTEADKQAVASCLGLK